MISFFVFQKVRCSKIVVCFLQFKAVQSKFRAETCDQRPQIIKRTIMLLYEVTIADFSGYTYVKQVFVDLDIAKDHAKKLASVFGDMSVFIDHASVPNVYGVHIKTIDRQINDIDRGKICTSCFKCHLA